MRIAADAAEAGGLSLARYLPLRQHLRLSLEQATFQARGFGVADPSRQLALETIGQTFIRGYNAALVARDAGAVLQFVGGISPLLRGFAAEGAAMGAAIADTLSFGKPLLPACIDAFKSDFTYLVHVGAGWSLARVPWRRRRIVAELDPLLRWLAFDGLGFHDTYFHHRRIRAGWRRERSGYAARAYDQGVGRALWFVGGGLVSEAVRLISSLPKSGHPDHWSGLGLAMTYAGPGTGDDLAVACEAAGEHRAQFAQGAAFGCEARVLAQHVPSHTELAARAIWGVGAEELSGIVRKAHDRLPETEGDLPRYEIWRMALAASFSQTTGQHA
jgi:enediyne biosynthesis protein E3